MQVHLSHLHLAWNSFRHISLNPSGVSLSGVPSCGVWLRSQVRMPMCAPFSDSEPAQRDVRREGLVDCLNAQADRRSLVVPAL